MFPTSIRASDAERTSPLPGDEVISHRIGALTHAITIRASRGDVWPWLAQMGAGSRAGWYSYDFIDNGRRQSAARIVPEWQGIAVGTVFPALPGATDGFVVVQFEPERFLVLGWPAPGGGYITTWAFVLEEAAANTTRLITRSCAAGGYRFFGMPAWLGMPIVRAVHFIMQRKQLLGVAARAEAHRGGVHQALLTHARRTA